jgi:hypothetical protein
MKPVVSTLFELDEQGVAWISGTRVKVIVVGDGHVDTGSCPGVRWPSLRILPVASGRFTACSSTYRTQHSQEAWRFR